MLSAVFPTQSLVLTQNEVIRHPRDVIADHACGLLVSELLLIALWQFFGVCHPEAKQFAYQFFETCAVSAEARTVIEHGVEKSFGFRAFGIHFRAEAKQALRIYPRILRPPDARRANAMSAGMDQVAHHAIENAP